MTATPAPSRSPRRIGLILPSSNTTLETELPAIFAARGIAHRDEPVTFHASRMRMQHVTPEQLAAMNAQTPRAAGELADLRPDAVASGCLVAIMAQGHGYHRTAESEIDTVLRAGGAEAPVISSAGALLEAIGALGAGRVALVTPYVPALTDLVAAYLEAEGVEVADTLSLSVADNRAVGALDPAALVDHVGRLDLTGVHAIIASACVQMPSLPALEGIEQRFGLPAISAATATAWALMRRLELDPVAPGNGALLAGSGTFRGLAVAGPSDLANHLQPEGKS